MRLSPSSATTSSATPVSHKYLSHTPSATQISISISSSSSYHQPTNLAHITMVYYFTSTAVDPPAYIYVGKDKFESQSHPPL